MLEINIYSLKQCWTGMKNLDMVDNKRLKQLYPFAEVVIMMNIKYKLYNIHFRRQLCCR